MIHLFPCLQETRPSTPQPPSQRNVFGAGVMNHVFWQHVPQTPPLGSAVARPHKGIHTSLSHPFASLLQNLQIEWL